MTHLAAGLMRRICVSLWLAVLPLGSVADAAEFYKDRTISFIIGSAPGGGYDTYSRLVASHLGRHPPSKPPCAARRNSLSDVESLRRAVLANIAYIEAIELMLEELIGEASPEQLGGLMRGLHAAKAHAEEVKALFGPLDENVTNIALVRKA